LPLTLAPLIREDYRIYLSAARMTARYARATALRALTRRSRCADAQLLSPAANNLPLEPPLKAQVAAASIWRFKKFCHFTITPGCSVTAAHAPYRLAIAGQPVATSIARPLRFDFWRKRSAEFSDAASARNVALMRLDAAGLFGRRFPQDT
jgi:hypothetical protein